MNIITNYRVISAELIQIDDIISNRIRAGWQPLGGVCVERTKYDVPMAHQAMVMYEKVTPNES